MKLKDQVYDDGKYYYPVAKLVKISKNIKKEKVSLATFNHVFDDTTENAWGENSLLNLIDFKEHTERVMKANLSYPILVLKGSNEVCDGYHRLIKAKILGKKNIYVKFLTKKMIEQFRDDI